MSAADYGDGFREGLYEGIATEVQRIASALDAAESAAPGDHAFAVAFVRQLLAEEADRARLAGGRNGWPSAQPVQRGA